MRAHYCISELGSDFLWTWAVITKVQQLCKQVAGSHGSRREEGRAPGGLPVNAHASLFVLWFWRLLDRLEIDYFMGCPLSSLPPFPDVMNLSFETSPLGLLPSNNDDWYLPVLLYLSGSYQLPVNQCRTVGRTKCCMVATPGFVAVTWFNKLG